MKTWMISAPAVVVIAALAIIGCGSNSSGTGSAKPGYSKGVVTAKTGQNGITVNGVAYGTAGSRVTIDRTVGTEAGLKVGMVAQVKGSRNDDGVTGEGAEIEFDDNLEGMITALTTTTLTVFGQTIQVDGNTVFSGTSGLSGSSPLVIGDVVEVSGFPTGSGVILATFVEKKTGVTVFEIKGTVSNYSGGNTFTLTPPSSTASITVTLGSGVTSPSGFGNGKLVEVWTTDTNAGTSITAFKVDLEVELEPGENDETEVEGAITSYSSLGSFVVSGVTIDASGAIISGGTAADIKLNAKVEVEGTFSGNKLLAVAVHVKTTW